MTIRSRLGASARGTPRVPPPAGSGAQGFQGAQGAQGATGSQGAQGAQGATGSFLIRSDLTTLVSQDSASFPTGTIAYVVAEGEPYVLDTANTFSVSSPLIIARGAGTGRWFRRSKAYVIGNFTLWCQAYGFGVAGFTPGQLTVSHANAPEIALDTSAGFTPPTGQQSLAIDNLGNIWVTGNNSSFGAIGINKYRLVDCLATGTPGSAVRLVPPAPISTEAGCSVFDRNGGLWVANGGHGTFGAASVVRFGQKSYAKSGAPLPGVSIGAFSPGLMPPSTSNQQDMVFDAAGNLWISLAFTGTAGAPADANGGVIMLSAAQLQSSDPALVPAVFWRGSNFGASALGGVIGLAFGGTGLLWTTNFPGNTLRAWDVSSPVSGNPAPAIQITCATFNGPFGMAFDAAGNLWISNGKDNRLMRLPAASLVSSGAATADVILSQVGVPLTSIISFPNNPDRSGALPSGAPITP